MYDWNMDDAVYQIMLSREQKSKLVKWWDAAEQYFNNTILETRQHDPSKLTGKDAPRWGIDNLIPDAVRAFAAWVVNSSFEVTVDPLGDVNDPVRFAAANTLLKMIDYHRKQPQFTQMIRDIAIRTKLFNIVAQIDGWCDRKDEPYSRLVTHNDLYLDPTGWADVNESNGPRWIAVKYILSTEEVINRYGHGKLSQMTQGLISFASEESSHKDNEERYTAYSDKYEIIEWFGIDETEVEISDEETEQIVYDEINAWLSGEPVEPDSDINHEKALEYGDLIMVSMAEEYSGESLEGKTVEDAMMRLAEVGLGQMVQVYSQWRAAQQEFIDNDDIGGFRAKYPGSVYHVDFQIGMDEPLLGPEALDFPHYQIPVSVYRSHMNTGGLFGLGSMPEVLSLQNDLEFWETCEKHHGRISAMPPFLIDIDVLDPVHRKEGGIGRLLDTIRKGFAIIRLRSNKQGITPQFANIGAFSTDVRRIIDYIRYRIQEIIGPTPILRGNVSGEASGKAVAMRQESAAKPVTDTLTIIEGPLQKHFERMVLNILEFSPIEKIEQIAGPEGAMAIQFIRDNMPDFRCAVNVDLGTGMPTDWQTKAGFYMQLVGMGLTDPEIVGKYLGVQVPMKAPAPPPMPGGGGQGGPPGMGQGQPVPAAMGMGR